MFRIGLRRVLVVGVVWALFAHQISAVTDGGVLHDPAARLVTWAGAEAERVVVHASLELSGDTFEERPASMARLKQQAGAVAAAVARHWPHRRWSVGNRVNEEVRMVFYRGPWLTERAMGEVPDALTDEGSAEASTETSAEAGTVVVRAVQRQESAHVSVCLKLVAQATDVDGAAIRRELAWLLAQVMSVSPASVTTGVVVIGDAPNTSPSGLRDVLQEAGARVEDEIVPASGAMTGEIGWSLSAGNVHVRLIPSPSGTRMYAAASSEGLERARNVAAQRDSQRDPRHDLQRAPEPDPQRAPQRDPQRGTRRDPELGARRSNLGDTWRGSVATADLP